LKILLIDPPFYRILGFYNRYFPIGLVTLATYLKHNGLSDVFVYDTDFNEHSNKIDYTSLPENYPKYLNSFKEANHSIWIEIKGTIKKYNPDIIGISIWTSYAASSFFTAKLAKSVKPDCPVVMGGPHATAKADEILRVCPDVDYVIRGEGEEAFLNLITTIKNNEQDLTSIYGLSSRQGEKVVHNSLKKTSIDLNQYPFPDRSLLINEKVYSSEDMGLIMASRGCPYSCTYCATQTNRVNFRSSDHIIDEIINVKQKYGTIQFTFKDDSFTVNHKLIEDLCLKLINNKLKITWECNTRVNLINEKLLRLMIKAGCNFVKVGIESGSEKVLNRMKKGITHGQIKQAATLFKKVGIHWTGYFMIGVPGETQSDIKKTINFLYKIKPDFACIGVYEPFPGTAMFDEGINKNLIKSDMSYNDFFNTLPNNYYKKDPNVQTDKIPSNTFLELSMEINQRVRSYNRNLKRVIRMAWAKSTTYRKNPYILLQDFKKYLSY